jgi:hypothetical protein
MTNQTPVKIGDRIVAVTGPWKGEVIGRHFNQIKIRWDTSPPREMWVVDGAVRIAHGEQLRPEKDGK